MPFEFSSDSEAFSLNISAFTRDHYLARMFQDNLVGEDLVGIVYFLLLDCMKNAFDFYEFVDFCSDLCHRKNKLVHFSLNITGLPKI